MFINWGNNPYSVPLLITSGMSLVAAGLAWQRRKLTGGVPLIFLLLSNACWTGAYALMWAEPNLDTKLFYLNLAISGSIVGTPAFLILAVQFTDFKERLEHGGVWWFLVEPALMSILLWTNSAHNLFYRDARLDNVAGLVFLNINFGAGLGVHTGYVYLGVAVIFYFLARKLTDASEIYRNQIGIILLATTIPLLGSILYVFFPNLTPHLDPTPFLLSFHSFGIAYGLLRYGLLDLAPIAREKVVASLRDGMIVLDLQNRIVDLNETAAQTMAPNQTTPLLGKNLTEIAPPIRHFLEGSPAQEMKTEITVGTTSPHYYDVLISPLRERNQKILGRLIIFREITERKRAELALRESENRLRAFLEIAPDSILIANQSGQIVFANKQSEALFQYSVAELYQLKIEDLVPTTSREKHVGLRATYHQNTQQHHMNAVRNLIACRKNGDLVPVEINLSPIQTTEGILVISIIRDVSLRKEVEELRENLVHMMVHDLRNPLANIRSALELTRPTESTEELTREDKFFISESALASTNKMRGLIDNILDVHRLERGELKIAKQLTAIAPLVDELLLAQRSLSKQKQITLVNEVHPDLALVNLDVQLITRVLQNLIGNAIKFTPEQGSIYLSAIEQADGYCLSVRDTGNGIAPDVRDRLFQKFAVTRQAGHGTGLGLAFCKLVVEAHGGKIWVEEAPSRGGTTFSFTLPKA